MDASPKGYSGKLKLQQRRDQQSSKESEYLASVSVIPSVAPINKQKTNGPSKEKQKSKENVGSSKHGKSNRDVVETPTLRNEEEQVLDDESEDTDDYYDQKYAKEDEEQY